MCCCHSPTLLHEAAWTDLWHLSRSDGIAFLSTITGIGRGFLTSPWNASVTLLASFRCGMDVWGSGGVFGSQQSCDTSRTEQMWHLQLKCHHKLPDMSKHLWETNIPANKKQSLLPCSGELIQSVSAENNPRATGTRRLGESSGNNQR